eukprot:6214575-Pleurochrysis_carterae.AAC.1
MAGFWRRMRRVAKSAVPSIAVEPTRTSSERQESRSGVHQSRPQTRTPRTEPLSSSGNVLCTSTATLVGERRRERSTISATDDKSCALLSEEQSTEPCLPDSVRRTMRRGVKTGAYG